MYKIAVKRNDGGVSIIIPTSESTPELLLRDILAVEGYVSHREVLDNELPTDRIFRNAWTDDFNTSTIDVNPDRARDLIRIKRNQALQALDHKAIAESRKPNGNTQNIEVEADRLRDIPQRPEFATNDIEILKLLFLDAELKI